MRFIKKATIKESSDLLTFLVTLTSLSKSQLKKVVDFGGVWLGTKRLRRVQTTLKVGDQLSIYYDSALLEALKETPLPIPLFEGKEWGVWIKPQGVLTQGTSWGDQASLVRIVEKRHTKAYLVHRLDRETAGLVVMAYSKTMAAKLSKIWADGRVQKQYQAIVSGNVALHLSPKGEIRHSLDGKTAHTSYEVISSTAKYSHLRLTLHTGRFHQLRRHLLGIGHPVMGDPLYGQGNKNTEGLLLAETSLSFPDPSTQKQLTFELPKEFYQISLVSSTNSNPSLPFQS